MTIRDRVRAWLGLDTVATTEHLAAALMAIHRRSDEVMQAIIGLAPEFDRINNQSIDRHVETVSLFNALRAYAGEQLLAAHNREEDRHGEIIEFLTKLEQHFVSQHVGTRPASMPVLDWEQVQIQELAEMLANPPKEVA